MTDTDKLKRLAEDASFGAQRFVISEDVAKSILALIAENERLRDSVSGLESDLRYAVLTAYRRGATEWAELNYPQWADWLKSHNDIDSAR